MDFDSLVKETKITLACKDLKDDDIEVLAEVLEKSTIVTEMDLMLNQITLSDDVFTNALATNESLKILNLYNNKIGVEGAKRLANAIANNKTLEQLNLEGAEIGDDGVKYLAETLKSNSSLEVLILRGNNIGDDGAASLATSLLFNTSIRVILLGQNRISDAGADKLAEVIEYNSVLDQIMLDSNNVSNILDLKIRNALGKPSRKKSKKEQALPRWLFENMLAYKDEKLTEKDAAIKTLQDENSTLEAKIDCKDQEIALLRQLEDEIILLDQKILKRDDAIATMMKEMANKDEKIASMATEISSLKSSLQKPLELLSELLNRKDEEISSLKAKNKSIAKNTPKRSESYVEISFSSNNNQISTTPHFFFDDDISENIDPRSPKSTTPAILKERPMSQKSPTTPIGRL